MADILLTGATGLVGSFLLRELLKAGAQVAVLARGQDARERLQRQLQLFSQVFSEKLEFPRLLVGDLKQPWAGLNATDRQFLSQHRPKIVHCAGVIKFVADGSGEPYCTNLDGTRTLLQLAQDCSIREFHHVSTAYVCGRYPGPFREGDLDLGQAFHNDYERSKFLAEERVRSAPQLDRVSIYRPSVVLGDAATGFTPVFHGAYEMLWLGWSHLRQGMAVSEVLSKLGLKSQDKANLVSADWVAQRICQNCLNPSKSGLQTHHLCNPDPPTWGQLIESLWTCAPISPGTGPTASRPVEQHPLLEAYRAYLTDHPVFETSSLCPRWSDEQLLKLCRYAVEQNFRVEEPWSGPEVVVSRQSPCLSLCLEGRSGGHFGLIREQGRMHLTRLAEAPPAQAVQAFCSTRAWQALEKGQLSLDQALHSGLLLLEGPPDSWDDALVCLRELVTS